MSNITGVSSSCSIEFYNLMCSFLKRSVILSCLLIISNLAFAGEIAFEHALSYIDRYKDFAISEMERTGIPASIKMGQAILESDYGRSKLAVKASNHFGAKCHNTWNGERYYHDDDAPNECFRKYKSVYESFVDHSYVLAKKRYASLFQLNPYDYKSWAVGLKKAGYATNPKYSQLLIRIIERYGLQKLDTYEEVPRQPAQLANSSVGTQPYIGMNLMADPVPTSNMQLTKKTPTKANGLTYVYYDQEVSPEQIARTYAVPVEKVLQYNDMLPGFLFPRGWSIYLSEKRDFCITGLVKHRVREGETMYGIAQAYGIKLRSLYHMNALKFPKQPKPGDELVLVRENSQSSTLAGTSRIQESKPKDPRNGYLSNNTVAPASNKSSMAKHVKGQTTDGKGTSRSVAVYGAKTKETSKTRAGAIYGAEKAEQTKDGSNEVFYHTVQSYDTLVSIAQAYGITVAKLKALNSKEEQGLSLVEGMKLRID